MADAIFPRRFTQFFPITPNVAQPIVGPTQSDGRPLNYCGGIVTDNTGTIVAIGRAGGAPVTLLLLEGVVYEYSLSFVISTSAPMNLIGLY